MIGIMRSFIAVDAIGSEIARLQQEIMSSSGWNPKDVKPVEPSNFHFTLIFLGELTSDQQIEKIKAKLTEVNFQPFSITYTGVGAFPKPSNARIVWIGIDHEGSTKLEMLARQVTANLAQVGFVPDKPFSPHLTIFRAKNRYIYIDVAKYAGKTFGTGIIDKVHLKKSELGSLGPTYSNIYTVSATEVKGV